MKAVIVAGGKGSRLGEITKKIPKPLIRICKKPIIQYQIELLRNAGFTDILICLGYLSEKISSYLGDGKRFGVAIDYHIEKTPLGTAGCIKEIEGSIDSDFLVLYGDILINMDIRRFCNYHNNIKDIIGTIVVHPNNHPHDSDLVLCEQNLVKGFLNKPHDQKFIYKNLVNAAVYLFSKKIFSYIKKGEKQDFAKDILPTLIKTERLYAYYTPEYFLDIGTPDRIKKAEQDITSGKFEICSLNRKRPAIFLDRDGVVNKKIDNMHKTEDFELLPGVADAVKDINDSKYLAVIATNQPMIAKGFLSLDELEKIHNKMETLLGNYGAKIDAIYFCPHHPESGFSGERKELKIDCECRKPKIGMINSAKNELNIDLQESYIIGDSYRDILCGINANIATIGVRTGDGCKDSMIMPDYFFNDLKEATDFILKNPYIKIFKNILEKIYVSTKKPFVILIGGNSRTGKSILAKYLESMIRNNKKNVLTIHLDNWLLSKEERKEKYTVYERFQLKKIEEDISSIFHEATIRLKEYSPILRSAKEKVIEYNLKNEEIIIIEGVVALSSEPIRKMADLKIFCEIGDNLLKKKLFEYYSWKGLRKKEIEELYNKRQKDEYAIIKKDKKYADIIVD